MLRIHSCHVSSSGLFEDNPLSCQPNFLVGDLFIGLINSLISSIPFVFDGTVSDFFDEPHVDETVAFSESILRSIVA